MGDEGGGEGRCTDVRGPGPGRWRGRWVHLMTVAFCPFLLDSSLLYRFARVLSPFWLPRVISVEFFSDPEVLKRVPHLLGFWRCHQLAEETQEVTGLLTVAPVAPAP